MTPNELSDFVGPDRVKARLELAITAARERGEALGHVLLLGSPGSGQTTLAKIMASIMAVGFKHARGPEIENAGDLARLVATLEKRDVLFMEEIHRLPKAIAEYLSPALSDFKFYLPLDQGGYTRPFRLNAPVFTLIGSAPNQEQLSPNLLSHFPIVESLEG
jgi:Holliday junction DNA helicase RuvB